MRKIFILGGSQLQLDLILEAKKMFFYTIVLDVDSECIGSKWCDEFLPIDISNKELVLKEAVKYNIDSILTAATEIGNLTACFVGESLGLKTNPYEVALKTTNKEKMKEVLSENNINTARHKVFKESEVIDWALYPCVVKPADSSAGRGVGYCNDSKDLLSKCGEAFFYSKNKKIIVEEYIDGDQFSVETISVNGKHQILTITEEYIRDIPDIVETHHSIPAQVDSGLKEDIEDFAFNILDVFGMQYGAGHIEIRIDSDYKIYVVEIASRVGGLRTEMISLSLGVSYSQILLFSTIGMYRKVKTITGYRSTVKILLDQKDLDEYKKNKESDLVNIFEPVRIDPDLKIKRGKNLTDAYGHYYILEDGTTEK